MLNCREIAELASDYTDGELPRKSQLAVGMHLLFCRHCRGFIHNLEETTRLLRNNLSRIEASEEWLSDTRSKLRERLNRGPSDPSGE